MIKSAKSSLLHIILSPFSSQSIQKTLVAQKIYKTQFNLNSGFIILILLKLNALRK